MENEARSGGNHNPNRKSEIIGWDEKLEHISETADNKQQTSVCSFGCFWGGSDRLSS
jgi:hypothetical protein